jgi:glycosyltransferase involved in cell wall biosynthesis
VAQPVEAGVPRVVVDLVADQVRRGWEVWVSCPAEGWLPAAARDEGARVVSWRATREPGPAVLSEARALAGVVRRIDPDVVHLHSAKAGLAGRLAVRGRRPTVFQPHAWSFLAADGLLRSGSLAWERWAARWTDLVVAVSQAEADRGAGAGVSAPVLVSPNGVDVTSWTPLDRATVRGRLGLGPGPLAVCAGRLSVQKGQDSLARVWPAVRERVPGARLLFLGDGPARAAVEALAGPGMELRGAVADLRPWYAAADVVVVPSRWEGMALVPLEAMACGRSVVATDVDGIRETLGSGAGGIVPVRDGAALLEAVVHRLTDPDLCSREGAAGRARVLERFDVRRCTSVVGDAVARLVTPRQ